MSSIMCGAVTAKRRRSSLVLDPLGPHLECQENVRATQVRNAPPISTARASRSDRCRWGLLLPAVAGVARTH